MGIFKHRFQSEIKVVGYAISGALVLFICVSGLASFVTGILVLSLGDSDLIALSAIGIALLSLGVICSTLAFILLLSAYKQVKYLQSNRSAQVQHQVAPPTSQTGTVTSVSSEATSEQINRIRIARDHSFPERQASLSDNASAFREELQIRLDMPPVKSVAQEYFEMFALPREPVMSFCKKEEFFILPSS